MDTSDEKALDAKRVCLFFLICAPDTFCNPYIGQTVIALDLYLAYLRAAFNTCYYCAVTTDHLEELQRKCIKHVRKPLSKTMLQELQAAEAQKAEQAEDGATVKKEEGVKDKAEGRDWKRNGASYLVLCGYSWITDATCR